jgi:benzodiazapine receptor
VVDILTEPKSSLWLRWVNVAAFIVTILVNALASTAVLNNISTGSISDKYETLVTPAGYVFSIWSVIYILLFVFVAFQALSSQKGKPFQNQVGALFLLSCVFNIVWIFLWQYEYITLSVPLMFALLASLIAIYLRLNIGKADVPMREKLAVHLPFGVYLGWITIATIADVAAALVSLSWNGFGISNETWAILVIIVALIIALLVTFTRRDVAYDLVIIWALVGIAVKQSANQNIVTTTEISAIIVAIALLLSILVSRFRRQKK